MIDVISFIKSLIKLPADQQAIFESICRPVEMARSEIFIREGQMPRKMAFVEKGLFRYYYVDNAGNEYTKNFITEGNFIASYSAMVARKASALNIAALEDCQLTEFNYTDWEGIRTGHPCWNELLIKFLEKGFSIKEKRERELLLLDANQRYQLFLSEYPGLENRISQQLIASYLGISPVSLSRLKNSSHS